MKWRGPPQVEVAAKLRRPKSYVSKCESGERRVEDLDMIMPCSAAWQIRVTSLLLPEETLVMRELGRVVFVGKLLDCLGLRCAAQLLKEGDVPSQFAGWTNAEIGTTRAALCLAELVGSRPDRISLAVLQRVQECSVLIEAPHGTGVHVRQPLLEMPYARFRIPSVASLLHGDYYPLQHSP